MHLDRLDSISLAGSSGTPNDDRAGTADTHAWVIDGATDLGPPGLLGARGGAAWLAGAADAAFAAAEGALAPLCAAAFDTIARRYAAARRRAPHGAWELPCASMLVVAIEGDALAIGTIGDCAALHWRGGAVAWLGNEPSRSDERAAAAALGDAITGAALRHPDVIADRRAARAHAARRALSPDADAARAVLATHRRPIAPGDELLLMTDGFSALVDGYAAMDAATLFARVRAEGLAPLAVALRAIEQADADCRRHPRFKRSDDATALWLRVGS